MSVATQDIFSPESSTAAGYATARTAAQVVLVPDGRALERHAASAVRIGRRGVILELSAALSEGAHVWLDLDLDDETSIRPLAQVTAVANGWTALRFVHLFPNHARALDAFHAQHATTAGY